MRLVFYELEEMVHRTSYKKILKEKELIKIHKKLNKKFGLKTKLKFDDRTYGYYEMNTRVICIPKKCSLGVLLHELGHAFEHRKYGTTEHKNRLFGIINELNIIAEGVA